MCFASERCILHSINKIAQARAKNISGVEKLVAKTAVFEPMGILKSTHVSNDYKFVRSGSYQTGYSGNGNYLPATPASAVSLQSYPS